MQLREASAHVLGCDTNGTDRIAVELLRTLLPAKLSDGRGHVVVGLCRYMAFMTLTASWKTCSTEALASTYKTKH